MRFKLDYRKTIFVAGISSILIYLSIILIFNEFLTGNERDIVTTSVTMLSTIFAITIALTIIALQFIKENSSTKVLFSFIKSKVIIGLFSVYLFAIIYNLIILNFLNPILTILSILFSIICLYYVVFYIFYILEEIDDKRILKKLDSEIVLNISDEKYSVLGELLLKYVIKNDFSNFHLCLKIIFNKERKIIEKISNNKIDKSYTFDYRHADLEKIIYFFQQIYEQIFYEIVNNRRQVFLRLYLNLFEELQKILFPLLATRPYSKISEHYTKIGKRIIDDEFDDLYLDYWHSLKRICLYEFKNLNFEEINKFYDFKFEKSEDKNKRDKFTLSHIAHDEFIYHRLGFLTTITEKCLKKDEDNYNWFPKSILTNDLIHEAIKIPNRKTKISFIGRILYEATKIHDLFANKKIYSRFFFLNLHYLIENLKKEDKPIVETLTNAYVESQTKIIELNPKEVFREFAVELRFIKDNPSLKISFSKILKTMEEIIEEDLKK